MKTGYTMIDDLSKLPDINDFETAIETRTDAKNNYPLEVAFDRTHGVRPQVPGKYQKFIREAQQQLPAEAGMHTGHHYTDLQQNKFQESNNVSNRFLEEPMNYRYMEKIDDITPIYEHFNNINTCVGVAEHTGNCKVCSKLYKNDNMIYIIIIVILVIICILLIKKLTDLM